MAAVPKPVDEFVVYTQEPLPSSDTPKSEEQSINPVDTTAAAIIQPLGRIDSFPKTLPLPASSVLSPTTAASERQLPSLSEQNIVSPPETTTSTSSMLVQQGSLQSPASEEDSKVTTPLAELAGTAFDQEVAVRRRGASVVGEEISESIASLKVEEEDATPVAKEPAKPLQLPEVLDEATIAARKNNPAILDSLPQTPSAADFETARALEGNKFNPEYPNETKVAS